MTASSQTHKATHVSLGHIYPARVGDSGLISICHEHPADPTTDPRPAGLVQRLAFPSAAWAPVSTMGREPKARLSDKAASHPNQGSERQGHWLRQNVCVLCSDVFAACLSAKFPLSSRVGSTVKVTHWHTNGS